MRKLERNIIGVVLLFLFCFSGSSAQGDAAGPLNIQTVYSADGKSESLKGIVKRYIGKALTDLGDIKIIDRDPAYDLKVQIQRKDTADQAFITLSLEITAPYDGKFLYSDSVTGRIMELPRLCRALIDKADAGFLRGKYAEKEEDLSAYMRPLNSRVRASNPENMPVTAGVYPGVSKDDVRALTGEMHRKGHIGRELTDSEAEAIARSPQRAAAMAGYPAGSIDSNKIRAISRKLKEKGIIDRELTEEAAELASKYSEEAPRIAEVTMYAKSKARSVSSSSGVPEDAYRHILWSYLLTKEFGPAMAKEITDTHEVGATGNTPAERSMDINNNEVGMRYAMMGYTEASLADRVKSDSAVIRYPR